MKNSTKSILLFMIFCIPIRSALVLASRKPEYAKYMAYLLLIPAVTTMYIWLYDLRKTGAEVFGDKIWWNSLRPIHSLLYFAFCFSILMNKNNISFAWKFLALDISIGTLGFIYKRFIL